MVSCLLKGLGIGRDRQVQATYQDLDQILVGDIGELGAVELWDDELFKVSRVILLFLFLLSLRNTESHPATG